MKPTLATSEIDAWRSSMTSPAQRQILRNIDAEKCVGQSTADVFFSRLSDRVHDSGVPDPPETLIAECVEDPTSLQLSGQEIDSPRTTRLSRLVKLRQFVQWNLGDGSAISEEEFDWYRRALQDRLIGGADLPAQRRVSWVTKTRVVQEIVSTASREDAPNELRARLGLAHFQDDTEAVELRYPSDRAPALHTPTVLDADGFAVFRPAPTNGDWGRALDLNTGETCAPEAIHDSWQPCGSLKAIYRGRTTGAPPRES